MDKRLLQCKLLVGTYIHLESLLFPHLLLFPHSTTSAAASENERNEKKYFSERCDQILKMSEGDTSAEHSLSHFVDRAECFAQLELLVDASDGEVARTAQEALSLVVS